MSGIQFKVKPTETPNLPGTYAKPDGTQGYIAAGAPTLAFDAKVSENGDQWVVVNGGQVAISGSVVASPPNIANFGSYVLSSSSIAYEASRLIKPTAGVLFGIDGYNSKGSAQFIQVFDASGPVVPIEGSIPFLVITVPTVANFSIDFGYWGRACLAGIWVCNSSTGPTKTIGTTDCFFSARYI